ncbi:SGNH/GDSL hydrolase family protein [Sporolactobacillus sp. THM7-4]|nr:SGNH/GDSL hydrolase family protein [Sporolactobacillus sp. THM7-4]
MKKLTMVSCSVVLVLISLMTGIYTYNQKIERTRVSQQPYVKQQAKEEKILAEKEAKAEAKRKAEEKAIYEKHKGETLIYSPMGDSLAFGYFSTSESRRYINVLGQLIHDKLGYNVKIEGDKLSGATVWNNGIPDLNWVKNQQPDLVTIEYGTNDLDKNDTRHYVSPSKFKRGLEIMIDKLRNSPKKPKIILLTTWNKWDPSIPYDNAIKAVGKQKRVPVADLSTIWRNYQGVVSIPGLKTYQYYEHHDLSDR